jgi:hypothetical protein
VFILDSLMISGISWTLQTVLTAAEAEMNDDTALREALLEAANRREMGEITDEEFADIEGDLVARIREIKERREGGSGPIAFGTEPMDISGDNRFQVEASVSGDFHDPVDAPHTTIVEHNPGEGAFLHADSEREIKVMDMAPGDATAPDVAALPTTPERSDRSKRSDRSDRSGSDRSRSTRSRAANRTAARTNRTNRTKGTTRTTRTTRTIRTK